MRITRWRRWARAGVVATTTLCTPAPGDAGPINTDVALTPREGGFIFRLQYVYTEASEGGGIEHLNASTVKATFVYGLRENLALFLTVPFANRQVDRVLPRLGRVEQAHDGLGDFKLLAKYRLWKKDSGLQQTMRWALLGGIDLRSGDPDFSSDSYDPIVGTVFSWRRERARLDADLVYQFNTGRGEHRHDALRWDVAWSQRLFPGVYDPEDTWEFDAVAEVNGRAGTDGLHEVFLSPGLQFITERWLVESSIQLPVIQHVDGPEPDYRLVLGMRWQW